MNRKRFTTDFVIRTVFFVTTVWFLSGHAKAQTVNGTFHGTVSDSSGAILPGATVEVKNASTDLVRQTTTTGDGFYTITQLPPGHYAINASKSGFTTARQSDVELLVNRDAEVNFTLQVGAVSQTVDVTAAPPALQAADATISQVIGSKQV